MTTIRCNCPSCGDVVLHQHEMKVRVCADTEQGAYVFQCPDCDRPVAKMASRRIVDLLVGSGVPLKVWRLPAELAEGPRDDVALVNDSQIDFHLLLERPDWFDQLVAGRYDHGAQDSGRLESLAEPEKFTQKIDYPPEFFERYVRPRDELSAALLILADMKSQVGYLMRANDQYGITEPRLEISTIVRFGAELVQKSDDLEAQLTERTRILSEMEVRRSEELDITMRQQSISEAAARLIASRPAGFGAPSRVGEFVGLQLVELEGLRGLSTPMGVEPLQSLAADVHGGHFEPIDVGDLTAQAGIEVSWSNPFPNLAIEVADSVSAPALSFVKLEAIGRARKTVEDVFDSIESSPLGLALDDAESTAQEELSRSEVRANGLQDALNGLLDSRTHQFAISAVQRAIVELGQQIETGWPSSLGPSGVSEGVGRQLVELQNLRGF